MPKSVMKADSPVVRSWSKALDFEPDSRSSADSKPRLVRYCFDTLVVGLVVLALTDDLYLSCEEAPCRVYQTGPPLVNVVAVKLPAVWGDTAPCHLLEERRTSADYDTNDERDGGEDVLF